MRKPTAEPFNENYWWPSEDGGRIPAYVYRPPYGSAADVIGRCTWQQPNRVYYEPREGHHGEKLKDNEYGKDWYYTLEIMREIGTAKKIDPTEDVLLGIYMPR